MNEYKIMKQLLEKENWCANDMLDFLRETNLVNYSKEKYYVYKTQEGEYIGNDVSDDESDILNEVLADQDFDQFMEEYIEKYIDSDLKEKFIEEGLTNEEIAMKLLEEVDENE